MKLFAGMKLFIINKLITVTESVRYSLFLNPASGKAVC